MADTYKTIVLLVLLGMSIFQKIMNRPTSCPNFQEERFMGFEALSTRVRLLLCACAALVLIGCGRQSESRVSGEIVILTEKNETIRPEAIEIWVIDRQQARNLFASEGKHSEPDYWPRALFMNRLFMKSARTTILPVDSTVEQNIHQLPSDSKEGKLGRQFLETTRQFAESQKQHEQKMMLSRKQNDDLLRKAAFKVVSVDSGGRFSFRLSQQVTNVALFTKFERATNGVVEEFAWLLPLAYTNEQKIIFSNSNLLSEADAFAASYPIVEVVPSKRAEDQSEIESLKARLQELESRAKTEQTKQSLDPVAQLKMSLQRIQQPGSDWEVGSYDVRRTDSLVNPIIAQVDLVLKPIANTKIGYRAYLFHGDGQWTLKGLEKSMDRDGSTRPGRMRDVPKGEGLWYMVEGFFAK